MSRYRAIVSIFLICHLAALAVATVPSPKELRASAGVRESTDDAVSSRVRPVLDWVAGVLEQLANQAWQLTAFARPLASRYVERLGLVQGWKMFASPPRGGEYLRFRYYSAHDHAGEGGQLTRATELVFPVAPDTENHVLRAYWQAHQDKAVSNALGAYFDERLRRMDAGLPVPSTHDRAFDGALARSFLPVVHFFSTRYTRTHLAAGDRLLWTEAWYGWASSRPRGDVLLSPQLRAQAIARYYYRGPAEEVVSQPVFQPIDSVEWEADVQWQLLYIQTP